ncbi:MAG: prephenate dehydratase [Planctomycetes bacterium]|nr:prephenate dehydratase [Planctomycetota bacterium]
MDPSIAEIDRKIAVLVQQRFDLLKEIGSDAGTPAEHSQRTQETIREFGAPYNLPLLERVLPFVSGVTYQHAIKRSQIAYLGPEYSYSYTAARTFFGSPDGFQPVQTIAAVFEEIERHQSNYGVVPIENSTDGRIVDTLTMFIRKPIKICGEVLLPIHHNLLAKCEREEIKEVHSKPQALSQCRTWLSTHLPSVRWVEVTSTAIAARHASESPGVAAVASKDAAIALQLNVVAENIEDNPNNVTRFAIIGNEEPAPTGNDKTSMMFQVPHRPGALADVMLMFRENGLNLTWIESFPVPGVANEYFFFVELDGHRQQSSVAKSIASLEKTSIRFNFLGSYPKGLPPQS